MESRLVIGPLAERLVGNRGEKDKIRIWGNGRSVQPFFTFEFSGVAGTVACTRLDTRQSRRKRVENELRVSKKKMKNNANTVSGVRQRTRGKKGRLARKRRRGGRWGGLEVEAGAC